MPQANVITSHNGRLALRLARDGFRVFPCHSTGPSAKRPLTPHGFKDATDDLAQVRKWWAKWPDAAPGLPTGEANGVSVIDLDTKGGKDGKDGIAAARARGIDPDAAGFVVRTPSGGLHLIYDHAAGVRNETGADGFDVRGEGGYIIAPGARIEGGTYEVERGGDLDTARILGLPDFPAAAMRPPRAAEDGPQAPPGGFDLPELESALEWLPNDEYQGWTEVGMALHHETRGSKDGLALYQAWSARDYPGYSSKEVAAKWLSFGNREGQPEITAATIFARASEAGWGGITTDEIDDMFDVIEGEGEAPKPARSPLEKLNARFALTVIGSSAAVADFGGPQVKFLGTQAFKDLHGNRKVGGQKLGTWWMDHPKRRTYDLGVVFDPSGRAPEGALNLWTGWAVQPDPRADCGLILEYIREVVAGGDPDHAAYILTWLADIVQNPARKPGVALVLKGLKGVGKDTLAEIMRRIIGPAHVAHVTNSARVSDRFNAQFATAILAHLEEASWGGDRQGTRATRARIENKGFFGCPDPRHHPRQPAPNYSSSSPHARLSGVMFNAAANSPRASRKTGTR